MGIFLKKLKSTWYLLLGLGVTVCFLSSCSDEETKNETRQILSNAASNEKNNQELKLKSKGQNNWLVDDEGNIKRNIRSVNRSLDDQEITLLEKDRKKLEGEFSELIQIMDENLDNPTVRKIIEDEMKSKSTEYKQKILLLAKQKLERRK